ncbi:MAG: SpoIIE family protein phosphatase [Rhodospirillaceae bacterium]|nr:SpoIIE family protein phosphatase [Rhodospirillaceae bacterium]
MTNRATTAQPEILEKSDISEQLSLLSELGREFAASLDINTTLERAIERITDHLEAEGGALFLLQNENTQLRCEACVGETDITGIEIASDQGIVGRCVEQNTGEIVKDVSHDTDFNQSVDEQTGHTTKSILVAPLTVNDEKIGAIELINKKGKNGLFDDTDLHLLEVLSNSAALAILNARMAADLVEQEKLQRELELAAEIQRNLLPTASDPSWPILGINIPARTVSGDFFDFFELNDGRIAFCLGDVSGKGMNAALLMAKTASLYRCLGKTSDHPGKLMAHINEEICETSTRGMFVTLVGGIYDPKSKLVRLANAGHEPPLHHIGENEFIAIEAEAPPVGITTLAVPEDGYVEVELSLKDGPLYIFTDGATEGVMADGSRFEISGIETLLSENRGQPLSFRLQSVVNTVNRGEGPLHDDITILGLDAASPSEAVLSFDFGAHASKLKQTRARVSPWLQNAGLPEAVVKDVVLAIDEACQNIIRHAYRGNSDQNIELKIIRQADELLIYLRDFATRIDVSTIKPRALEDIKPGGLGTHFINEIMDEVDYLEPKDDNEGNLMRMVKSIIAE